MSNTLQPPGWKAPKGYTNGIATESGLIFVAGQIGWNANCEFESDDLSAQVRQTLQNIIAVLKEASAGPEHITRMTWYVTDKQEYRASQRSIGEAYREVIGSHYPPMTLLEVSSLLEDRAKVEIEVTAFRAS